MLSFIVQSALVIGALVVLAPPLGIYLADTFEGRPTFATRVLGPLERLIYRVCRIDPAHETDWGTYAVSLISFNVIGVVILYLIARLQGVLPMNPSHAVGQSALLAFNTAVSFVTNTNWQAYAGETGASQLTQMIGLTWQNFVSAACGLAVAIALIRGITRSKSRVIGNVWADITRGVVYVFLPLSVVFALFFVSQGVVQTLGADIAVTTVEGISQTIARGPIASQEAIKMLGTNGGGYFNANSAHPFENPTAVTSLLQVILLLLIPAALTQTFGRYAGNARQGWAIFSAMLLLFVLSLAGMYAAEQSGNPLLTRAGADQAASALQGGGNMEGKEVRFGTAGSALFGTATTAASCGAVNAMHDSMTPLGGGLAMLNILLGEVIFGGVGVGLAGMLLFALLAVFIAGLMVGRTPEYAGKKVEAREIQLSILAILVVSGVILLGAGIASVTPAALAARLNVGPHGLSELLYAFASAGGNNGSAFAGLNASGSFFTIGTSLAMLIGRFFFIIPVLGIAGSLAQKQSVPASAGTFPTDSGMFVGLLVGTVLIVGALTFFPALALGPIVEHFLMLAGKVL
jgi:K+-transporting ATPase ATPase A chain